MRRASPSVLAAFGLAGCLVAASSDAQVGGPDPARRGLDLFVHVPDQGAPGGTIPLQIEAFGFPSVVALQPLGAAAVEAAWDPESLGPGLSVAPPPVRGTTDSAGRAHLDVPIPDGDVRDLQLLIGVRTGGHERTRTVKIHRGRAADVALHVVDTHVVPGSSISAWVVVTRASTGEPLARQPMEIRLLEGGYARHTIELTTDDAGTALARVPIPRNDEPSWTWQLEARTIVTMGQPAVASTTLTPREETPGTPRIFANFIGASILAGDPAPFLVRVRDATNQPVVGLPIRYWTGPRGTEPPKDEALWERAATFVRTDAAGEIHGETTAPSTVVKGVGTTLRLVAKTSVEGRAIESESTVAVGVATATAELLPQNGSVVPGIEQRMLLRVLDGHFNPVAASFSVEADGLKASVTTDADGEAEVVWHPPADVGAMRNVGPCAGGVAASVRIRALADVPALHPRTEPFELCVAIDRDATAMIALERPIASVGDRVHVRVLETEAGKKLAAEEKRGGARPPWSVVLRSENGEQTTSQWIDDGDKGGDLEVPSAAAGTWTLSAVAPGTSRASRVLGTALLVTPRVIPKLTALVGGGRAAPGGAVEVDADLTDGHGRGLTGTVAAVLVDLHGGGNTNGLEALDLRRSICRAVHVADDRCDRLVEGDPTLDGLRRGELGGLGVKPLVPDNDPAANARAAMTKAFGEVLRSLEGAVFEASRSADALRDVRRKGAVGWVFNPELMTLVTAAMPTPPTTPGGEALALGDLLAVDPQVTFDNVARRIARLKIFRVLAEVRSFRKERGLDPDEPMFKNPNALLRRLVRDGRLTDDILLDPWGGTIQFTRTSGPPIAFLSVIHGFELHAPGPDGIVGNGDDVRDPFERVLRSGTPYADAVSEDRIVDAKFDLEVGDATVSAWQTLFEELTGSSLGGVGEGIGLGGIGTVGHGSGSGSGSGFGSGHGRLSSGISTGAAFWSVPKRTDDHGHVRIHVPLGDIETTWRIALVGVPDGARPATTRVDVPVALPLSARVDAGATWVEGDVVRASVTLRNRTDKPIHASLVAEAGGVAALVTAGDATRTADIAAGGAKVVTVSLRAPKPGAASLAVTVRAAGLPDDVLHHTWDVIEAGEPMDLSRSQLVDDEAELATPIDPQVMRVRGRPRVVLERGFDESLRAALESLDPDRLRTPTALVDAVEVAARIQRWAVGREGDGSTLGKRAAEIIRRALGRIAVYNDGVKPRGSSALRLESWSPVAVRSVVDRSPTCPPDVTALDDRLDALEGEPGPINGAALSCWDAFVTSTLDSLAHSTDPVETARAVLALADRPHRGAVTAALVDRLRAAVELRASGGISVAPYVARDRAARATIFAALLRTIHLGKPTATTAERLAAWIAVQRDVDGGYGSSLATRSVVRALLASGVEEKGTTTGTVTAAGITTPIELGPSSHLAIPLDPGATSVKITVHGPGLIARFERPALRFWSRPPEGGESPIRLAVTWPENAGAGFTGVVRVDVRHSLGRSALLDIRLPLPPSVSLAAPVNGVQQIQGVLAVRRLVDQSDLPTVIEIPVRFGLGGAFTVPEARATIAREEVQRAVAPARPLIVR
ncbi:MAG: alpha-2-macroglobulin family protein [Byssovorax sp.]